MKNIIHVSYSNSGGAGRVAKEIAESQNNLNGYISNFLFFSKTNLRQKPFENLNLTFKAGIDNYILKNRNWPSLFSYYRNITNNKILNKLKMHDGIIHLHWINGLLTLKDVLSLVNFGKKIVWTIHDMEIFTGGCHNTINCSNFKQGCQNCPAVKQIFWSKIELNKSAKNEILESLNNVNFVFPTKWLLNNFQTSNKFNFSNLHHIPNPIKDKFFELNTPTDQYIDNEIILGFVSNDLNDQLKQFDLVLNSVQNVSLKTSKKIKLVAIGSKYKKSYRNLNFNLIQTGIISDEKKLITLFSSFDLLLSNSLSESFGLTIAEASAIGVPSLILNGSGSSDFIVDGVNGFLFKNQSDFEEKLIKLIDDDSLRKEVGKNSRKNAFINFHPDIVLKKYENIYNNFN